jgi:hypothetical protein
MGDLIETGKDSRLSRLISTQKASYCALHSNPRERAMNPSRLILITGVSSGFGRALAR